MALAATRDGVDGSEKSAGAFRTISEVADELDVPQHVLRFWETRFTQIKPVKRAGGRRYYRPEDVDLIKGVKRLLHGQGYTIRGAQRILKEGGVRFVQSIGRGEAEAAAPAVRDADTGEDGSDAPTSMTATDRALLEDVLADLQVCRDRLVALRLPPEMDLQDLMLPDVAAQS
ncbi:MerR family transcriptional regulator [Methylobacterium sp. Leaf108]|uniref:MerR family transcriptional regulator n=1 Tax=Methylobacterium sp. Leaf108 TaxID=1736256 RepID=UPI0006F3773A|nr:MerR family transcriptional regulator [Methylobacterium sp. Leaf108]KQP51686.1 MerR family transcriptional regulator [Methylobacterium sp. Leaf108]